MNAYSSRDKELFYDTILESTSDLIFIIDNEGRVAFVNDAYRRVFGVDIKDVVGKNVLELYKDAETTRLIEENDRKVRETGETIVSEEIASTTRGLSTFLVTKSPWRDGNGNIIGVIGVSHDITERKNMEQALMANEANCHSMFEHCPLGIAVANAEGEIIQSNTAFERMLGYDKEELLGMAVSLFTHPEDMESEMSYIREMLGCKRDHYEIEKRYICKDGKTIWIRLIAITFLGAYGERLALAMTEDVTERRKDEEELHKTAHLLSTIFSGIDDHMYLKDRNSRMVMANSAVGNDFGMPVKQMIGKNELEFFEDKALARTVLDNDRRVMDSGETFVIEEEVRFKDGMRTFLSKKVPWKDAEGNVIGLFGISRDITERNQALIKLKESEEHALKLVGELEEANKNKNEFLSALSHEIRNPLAAISAGLQLMDATSDETHIRMAQEIMKRQTDQLCRIVDGLLDLMRITHNKIELKKEIIELNELMSISAKDHKPLFDNKGIELRLAENKDEIYVEADPVRIKQITGNLLHNALKFTESGGSVILSVYEEKGQAIICVKDSGIGISADDISNLFEPFAQIDKQIDRRLGGLGLGLAIVKEIAQLHGGDASAFSEGEGNGSSFYITLPLASDGKVQSPEITREEGRAKKLSVLLIEDNKDYCDMMCAMLKNLGYDTECVHHGLEGIAKAKECLPDAIICDIGLPGMSGYEVARTIRGVKNMNSVLLIALTGYTGSSDIEAAKEAGFDHHIAKPVNMEYLRCILNKA